MSLSDPIWHIFFDFRPKREKFRLFILDIGKCAETVTEHDSLLRHAKKTHLQKVFPMKTVFKHIFQYFWTFSYFLILKIVLTNIYLNFWFFRYYIGRSSLSMMQKKYLNEKINYFLFSWVKKSRKRRIKEYRWRCAETASTWRQKIAKTWP